MELVNQKNCNLMVWECDPVKRNLNNEIKFNIKKTETITVGDKIKCILGTGNFSVYEIIEVLDIKDSSIFEMNYVTALTKWGIE
jgi:predicted HAD superfamily phosphohydrolase YqeG